MTAPAIRAEATGGCLCGAVRFAARDVPLTAGVCHCEMCRRWTGSALIEVSLPDAQIDWQGEGRIARRQTSAWGQRGWCADCGSALFFRMTAENEFSGGYDIPLGLFDDPNGFRITHEIYIDHKPDSFAYAGQDDRKLLTRADCVAKFPLLDSEQARSKP